MIDPEALTDAVLPVILALVLFFSAATALWVLGIAGAAVSWARARGWPTWRAILLAVGLAPIVPVTYYLALMADVVSAWSLLWYAALGVAAFVTAVTMLHRGRTRHEEAGASS